MDMSILRDIYFTLTKVSAYLSENVGDQRLYPPANNPSLPELVDKAKIDLYKFIGDNTENSLLGMSEGAIWSEQDKQEAE